MRETCHLLNVTNSILVVVEFLDLLAFSKSVRFPYKEKSNIYCEAMNNERFGSFYWSV